MNKLADLNVVFLHIPKTGGTTLRSVIARQYEGRALYEIGNPINENLIAFREMDESDRHRYCAIQGHMSFGLHRYMPEPCTYITMLRDPVRRAISDYAFVSSNTLHPLYPRASTMSIVEYLQSGLTGQLENGQTRLLAGDAAPGDCGIPTVRPMTRADLQLAKDNIDTHCAVVGLLERFDESLLLMRDALGWKSPHYVRENVTDKRAKPVLRDADVAAIRELNALDIELYEYAVRRFDAAISAGGPHLANDLKRYRLGNRAYAAAQSANWKHLRPKLGRIKRRVLGQ